MKQFQAQAQMPQASSLICDGDENVNIAMDQVPLCLNDIGSHDTERNGTTDAATVLSEETNDLNCPNAHDCNENIPLTSSNMAGMASQANIEVENQEPPDPKPMKKCRLCPFVSRFRRNLKLHMHSHAGEKKPYKCHLCSKYFTNPEEVEKHLKFNKLNEPQFNYNISIQFL